MAIDTKKLMGAFGLNPQGASQQQAEDIDGNLEEDVFFPDQMPEGDDGRTAPVVQNTEAPPVSAQDFNSDVDYARRSQASLVNEAQKLVQIAMENAESGSSKDIFAAADTIRAASETAERLIALHEKIRELNGKSDDSGNTYVQNQVVFQGSTEDAMRLVREKMLNGSGSQEG